MVGMNFQEWLKSRYQQSTVNSRLANCQRIELYEGNLDIHYNTNQGHDLLQRLTYSKEDKRLSRPALHNIPIQGDTYNGTATFKQAANLYFRFKSGGPPARSSSIIRRKNSKKFAVSDDPTQMNKIEAIATELNLTSMPVQKLLRSYAAILDELKNRKILRSINNPVADYTEWLVAEQFGLTLAGGSTSGYDATNNEGIRFQIKARRVNNGTRSVQLSAIRNLADHPFDFLVAVIFEHDFSIRQALKIPIDVVSERATFQKHTNSHIFHVNDSLLSDGRIENITTLLANTENLSGENS